MPSVASDPSAIFPSRPVTPAARDGVDANGKVAPTPFADLLDEAGPPADPPPAPREARGDRTAKRRTDAEPAHSRRADDSPRAGRSKSAKDSAPAREPSKAKDASEAATSDETEEMAAAEAVEANEQAEDAEDAEPTEDAADEIAGDATVAPADAAEIPVVEVTVGAEAPAGDAVPTAAAVAAPSKQAVENLVAAPEAAPDAASGAEPTAAAPAEKAKPTAADEPADATRAHGPTQAKTADGPHVTAAAQPGGDGDAGAEHQNSPDQQRPQASEPPKGAEVAAKAHEIGETARMRLADADGPPKAADVSAAVRSLVEVAHSGNPHIAAASGVAAAQPASSAAAGAANAATPAAANAQPAVNVPVPVSELAVEIASRALAGKHRFEIRLDPPELGRIDVRLEVDRDGLVTSRLVVERPETLDMLRRDAGQLERALQQAGLKTSDQSLQFSLRQEAPGRDDSAPDNVTRLTVSEDDPQPLEALRQGYGRLFGLGRGLDIRV